MRKSYLFLLIGFMTLVWSGLAWGAPSYFSGTGHWYEAFTFSPEEISQGRNTWTDAFNKAREKGGYLATVTSDSENTFVYNLIKNDKYWFHSGDPYDSITQGPWIGGYQDWQSASLAAQGWKWVTGEPWSYALWASLEPNDYPYSEWPAPETGDENWLNYFNKDYDPSNPSSKKWAPTWGDSNIGNSGRTFGYVVEYNPTSATPMLFLLLDK